VVSVHDAHGKRGGRPRLPEPPIDAFSGQALHPPVERMLKGLLGPAVRGVERRFDRTLTGRVLRLSPFCGRVGYGLEGIHK
jgi:hypothetical protein